MKNKIHIFKNADELSVFFARLIIDQLIHKLDNEYFSLVLSGGSTPKSVFRYLALNFKDRINWGKILVFWGDERCVEPVNEESNFRMASENLLDIVPIPKDNIFRIKGEEDPVWESERYSALVKNKIPLFSDIPRFDFVMLGLGDDGHTASIFPGDERIINSKKLFEVAQNPYTKQIRISATLKLINQARNVAFFVTGLSKSDKVTQILNKIKGFEQLPASMVDPKTGQLYWFLDQQAAGKLDLKCG